MHKKVSIQQLIQQIQSVHFDEHPIKDHLKEKIGVYDLTTKSIHQTNTDFKVQGAFSDKMYCKALFCQLFTYTKADRKSFFQYQFSLIKNSLNWLEELDELLRLNQNLFKETSLALAYDRILSEIDNYQADYKNTENEGNDFMDQQEKIVEYHLPENFEITTLTSRNIKAKKLSTLQTGLLFYFLRDTDGILNFEDSSLARLVTYLTGKSWKRVKDSITYARDTMRQGRRKGDNLRALISYLTEILEELKVQLEKIEKDSKHL